jgi:glycosyltransferase involved in cell wall biosynthesis
VHSSPPSRFHESFGRSVVEAMALGVPTVCFRSGALQEIVVHEETGLICDESAASLTAALNRFLMDVAFRNRCGGNARRRYNELFSPGVVRDRWLQFFKSEAAQ